MTKQELGWNPFFEHWFQTCPFTPARILRKHNYGYDAACEEGVFPSRLRGRIRKETPKGQWPAVGDWVGLSFQQGYAMIEALAPRTGKISRKVSGKTSEEQIIAANADTIFLVVSLHEDYNLRKIERYLALASESGAQPVIVLNKIDLAGLAQTYLDEIQTIAPSTPVYCTNGLDVATLKPLEQYTGPGRTVVLLGSSGAGKSTIANELLGHQRQAVGAIGKNNKGVHTTSSRDMFFLKNGGILIDNPGIRELRVWLDSDEAIQDTFTDIEDLSQLCRFRDCSHTLEPDCAVQGALADGTLSIERLDNWRKISQETSELLLKRRELGRKSKERPLQSHAQAYKQMKKSGRKGLR